jgi:hypothetical protein
MRTFINTLISITKFQNKRAILNLYLDFTGIAILYKNLKMNVEWVWNVNRRYDTLVKPKWNLHKSLVRR